MKTLDDLKIYSVKEFDYASIRDIESIEKKVKRGKRIRKRKYKNIVCAFDIETTGLPDIEHSFMYVWQACIFPDVIVGRTWNEFKSFLLRLVYYLEDNETIKPPSKNELNEWCVRNLNCAELHRLGMI